MSFAPGNHFCTAVDEDTGATLELRRIGSQIEFLKARFTCPGVPDVSFTLELRENKDGPTVVIYTSDIERVFRAHGKSDREQNTALVENMISALRVIDQKWPLMWPTRLGTDLDEYRRKSMTFSFSVPSDSELASSNS